MFKVFYLLTIVNPHHSVNIYLDFALTMNKFEDKNKRYKCMIKEWMDLVSK